MAAYAALTSLMNLIHQIHHHPQPPVTLDREQTQSLTENIVFLQDFLEAYNRHYSNQEVERVRIRIADAAYAAEDVIESHIVDQLHSQYKIFEGEDFLSLRDLFEEASGLQSPIAAHDEISSFKLYRDLKEVIENVDYIKKDVEEIKDNLGTQEQLQGIITTPAVSPKFHSTQRNIMVGCNDVLHELLHKLTGQPHSDRQIIPISGMSGIGKTTLAQNLYTHPLVEQHFDILAWVVISQEYNMKEIIIDVLLRLKNQQSRENLNHMREEELGEKLYKSLFGRRYLIVMDDMWCNDVWDKVKFYFPRNNQGSRIIVTTRLTNVASYLSSGCAHEMDFLDQYKSWSLFCKTVFGEKDCPPELEEIGMEIARNCKGLPLSIVVLGGLLAKSKPTREYWGHILRNVSSIVNLEEGEQNLKILRTSYDELPVYLKVCFLYMAIFPEDHKILASDLISMWVAEGFLKPISGKSLEESGDEYLMDLIDRNLILVGEHGYSKKIKSCQIHDLLRDLCIREARKERFIFSANQHEHEGINTQRCIVIDKKISNKEYLQNLQSVSATRSLICHSDEALPAVECRLLRVFRGKHKWVDIFQQVNLRYFAVVFHNPFSLFSTSDSLLWNLQTLNICFPEWGRNIFVPPGIWKMPLLRHVECSRLRLPTPPSGDTDEFVLHNLHTLMVVVNLKLGEEVVKRIPNVKELRLLYEEVASENCCLKNLGHLYKLECLHCSLPSWDNLLPNLIFPHSLKELHLGNTRLSWEDINTKIGSLPHLQELKLCQVSVTTSEWETIQGQFCSLKYLCISNCEDWECWRVESSHFPRLEHLFLVNVSKLKEIPRDIGNIPTLESIQLENCSFYIIKSAKQIAEEQEELGNEGLRVIVTLYKFAWKQGVYEVVESLASDNFQVKIKDEDYLIFEASNV